jgi:hypothetical protein
MHSFQVLMSMSSHFNKVLLVLGRRTCAHRIFVRTPPLFFLHTDTTLQDQTLLTLIESIKVGYIFFTLSNEFPLKIFYVGLLHLWLYIFNKIKVYWNVWVFDYFHSSFCIDIRTWKECGILHPQSPKWTFEFIGLNQIPAFIYSCIYM